MTLLEQLTGKSVLVLGFNGAIANAEEDLWDASQDWLPFAAAVTLDVSSGSAADVLTSGTGAWTLRLIGLDADRKLQTEDINLNGQTAVVSTKAYLRLLGAEVIAVGTGLKNAGIIYIADSVVTQTAGVPSDLTKLCGWVAIGMNRTMSGFYTVPMGVTYRLRQLYMTARAQIVTHYLLTRTLGGVWIYQMPFTLAAGSDRDHWPGYEFDFLPGTDLKIRSIAAVTGGIGSAHLALERVS
jgi:hypothetical protein